MRITSSVSIAGTPRSRQSSCLAVLRCAASGRLTDDGALHKTMASTMCMQPVEFLGRGLIKGTSVTVTTGTNTRFILQYLAEPRNR